MPPTATTRAAGAAQRNEELLVGPPTGRGPRRCRGPLAPSAYEDTDLFANAVAEAQGRALLGQRRHEGELRALDAELTKVDAGIDRYLRAFETGAMPSRSVANG